MTTIGVQNIPHSTSIDNLIKDLTSDRKGGVSHSLECSHNNTLKQVTMITFTKPSSFKEALHKDNTVLPTASDSVGIGIDDHFQGFMVVARGSSMDVQYVEYGCSVGLTSQANNLQYCHISWAKWTCL